LPSIYVTDAYVAASYYHCNQGGSVREVRITSGDTTASLHHPRDPVVVAAIAAEAATAEAALPPGMVGADIPDTFVPIEGEGLDEAVG
jgi:hypothetical protein